MTEYPEILQDLLDKLIDLLASKGLSEETARSVATETIDTIRKDWGGLNLYIPKGKKADRAERDLEIYKRFDGRNRQQVCREYSISEQRLYQIVNAVRAKEKDEHEDKKDI